MRGGQQNTIYKARGVVRSGGELAKNATINANRINLPLNNAILDCMSFLFRPLLLFGGLRCRQKFNISLAAST